VKDSAHGALSIEMLPARHGDAILLSWGEPADRHRMLVDAGPAAAYDGVRARLRSVAQEGPLDLLVLTHVDADHVEGMILLVNDADVAIDIREVWFNAWVQLGRDLDAVHGEILSALITERRIPWNVAFGGAAVCSDSAAPAPVRTLPGGLRLTVLGPSSPVLGALRDVWIEACDEAGLRYGSVDDAVRALRARPKLSPGRSFLAPEPVLDVPELARSRRRADASVTNASSIVLLAEYGEHRVLLAGDAAPRSLLHGVHDLLDQRGLANLPLTALKLPHHGSAKNVTAELVRLLPADRYLFSTDGSYHGHPDDAAVATVLEFGTVGAELVFNYATPRVLKWDDTCVRERYRHQTSYPSRGPGIEVVLAAGTEVVP
jgi:hypothetical protein